MRIVEKTTRGETVSFSFNGKSYTGYKGESVACALFACGVKTLRHSPIKGEPRGFFCLMGSCQECLIWVDKQKKPACQVPVSDGMEIASITQEDM